MTHTALVTGGTRGIGKAIALQLKSQGYKTIATYNTNHEEADKFSKENGIDVISWDVSSPETSVQNASKISEKYGCISTIIHNAGITQDSFFHKMTYAQWQSVLSTNLLSCYNVINPFIMSMREKQYGRIVVISSINALKGQAGQTNYSAAKAGIIGFVKALALENANKNITVNAVAPGYVETDMVKKIDPQIIEKIKSQIPSGRLGQPHEIAHAVSFLCDDLSSFITGETLNINGGQYLS
jgi:acetoacetyl-CoA reductase